MEYYPLNRYLQDTYGRKLYKVSIDGGFTCPNRDGTLGKGGCIFCLEGSGAFAQKASMSVTDQIDAGIALVRGKMGKGSRPSGEPPVSLPSYIAYFQSYTGTYAPIAYLREKYMEAAAHPEVAVISIATRPDCLGSEVLSLLSEINLIKPVWIELGLQTVNEDTAKLIRRGYGNEVYDRAVRELTGLGIPVITHVIIGLPGEGPSDWTATVRHAANTGSWGIKLQLLHILEGTDLADMYRAGEVKPLTLEEYGSAVVECLKEIPPHMVVHRITGDGDKKHLLAPLWSADKKRVLNYLTQVIDGA